MKKFWRMIGGIYIYLRRNKKLTPLLLALVFIIQFLLIIIMAVQLNATKTNVEAFKESSLHRQNQIYSMVYMLNSRVNQIIEKTK